MDITKLEEEIAKCETSIEELEEENKELDEEWNKLEEETNWVTEGIGELHELVHELEKEYEKYPTNDDDDNVADFYDKTDPIQTEIKHKLSEVGIDASREFHLFQLEKDSSFDLKDFLGDDLWYKLDKNENQVEREKNKELDDIENSIVLNQKEIEEYQSEIKQLNKDK